MARQTGRIIGGWCETSPTDSRFTFVGAGRRPSSQSTLHRIVAFHLRGEGKDPPPWKSTENSSHQIAISYSYGKGSISLFQAQIEIPKLSRCTADYASALVASFVARRLGDCIEPYARFLTPRQRQFHPEVDTDQNGDRNDATYESRLQYYWATAIDIKLKDLIRNDGVSPF
jgi:hypothetical protein